MCKRRQTTAAAAVCEISAIRVTEHFLICQYVHCVCVCVCVCVHVTSDIGPPLQALNIHIYFLDFHHFPLSFLFYDL